MSFLRNLSLKVKLPLFLMGFTALAMGISGYFHIVSAFSAVRDGSAVQLVATRDARARQIEDLIERIDNDIRSFATSAEAQQALRGLDRSWGNMSVQERAAIRALYGQDNPNALGQRAQLEDAGDRSEYSLTHAMSHTQMLGFMQSLDYGDLLILNPEGDVIYSVQKREDFGANIAGNGSPLGGIFAQLIEQVGPAEPVFVDVTPYAANGDLPTAFIGQRLVNVRGDTRGMLVLELPRASIQAVIDRPAGLGNTGEAYLLGPDGVFRTAPRVNMLDTAYYSTRAEAEFLTSALSGAPALKEAAGVWYDNATVTFTPVAIWGQSWTLVLEKSMDEILAPAVATRNSSLMEMGMVQVAIFVMSWLFARSLTGPLGRVVQALRDTAGGNLSGVIADAGRKDEIGQIAAALGDLRGELQEGQSAARDAQYKGAAFDQSSAAMMIADESGIVTYINPAAIGFMAQHQAAWAAQGTAIDPDSLVGTPLTALYSCDDLEARFSDTVMVTAQLAAGDARLNLTIGRIVDSETGAHTGYIVEWVDVTESRRSATILNAIETSQAVLEMTACGQIIGANSNMLRVAGADGFPALLETISAVFENTSPDVVPLIEAIQRAQGGETVSGTFACKKPNGEGLWLMGSINPVLEDDGTVSRMVAIMDDVSTQRVAQERAASERENMQALQDQVVARLGVGLNSLADGDLQACINETFSAEYEQLRLDFNSTTSRLRSAMKDVRANAESIRGEVADISNAAADLSARTETQAATLEQTAAAIEEITASVKSAAEGATAANDVVRTARKNGEQNGVVVTKAVSAMGEISASSTKISKIVEVIDDIAFQTNLLALNAGVEAARAGDAGRGFAVVASEVRALALRSSEAAKDINVLISESTKHVSHGVDLVGKAGTALQEIMGFVADISDHVSNIELSAKEQSSGLSEINTSMGQLDQVTQQNAAMFEETTAASQSLNSEADTLLTLIQHFKIDGDGDEFSDTLGSADHKNFEDGRNLEETRDKPAPSQGAVSNGALKVKADLGAEIDDWQEF